MTTPHTHTPRTPSQNQPDPEVLGRGYAKTVSTVLDTAAEIAHEVWLRETANMTGRPVDPTLLRHLSAPQAHNEANLKQATARAHALTQMTPTQAGPALAALNTEIETLLTRRLHTATRRLKGEPVDHPHACNNQCLDTEPGPSINHTEPDVYVFLTEAMPEELAVEHASAVATIHDHISPALFDPRTDFNNTHAQIHQNGRLDIARQGLRWLNLLGQSLTQLAGDDARHALAHLSGYTNQELDRVIHNTRHQLQPDPNTRCRHRHCDRTRQPARDRRE